MRRAFQVTRSCEENTQVWMSHGDTITVIPSNFKKIASTDKVAIAAYQIENEKVWGVQFHPEVFHSEDGTQMLKNFVVDVCGCKQDWSAASFIETTVAELKEQLGDDKVVLGLSGGVDSSVAAVLLNRAIGKKKFVPRMDFCVNLSETLLLSKAFFISLRYSITTCRYFIFRC